MEGTIGGRMNGRYEGSVGRGCWERWMGGRIVVVTM